MDLPVLWCSTKLTFRQDITTLIFCFKWRSWKTGWIVLLADFICQLDWAMGCPDIRLSIILVYVWLRGCLSVEFTLKSVDWESRLSSPMWEALSSWLSRIKGWVREFFLSLPDCPKLGHQPSSAFILGLRLEIMPLALLPPMLWVLDQNCTIGSPGSPACWLQLLDFSPSVLLESIPDSKSLTMYVCIYVPIYLPISYWLFSGELKPIYLS